MKKTRYDEKGAYIFDEEFQRILHSVFREMRDRYEHSWSAEIYLENFWDAFQYKWGEVSARIDRLAEVVAFVQGNDAPDFFFQKELSESFRRARNINSVGEISNWDRGDFIAALRRHVTN